MIFFDALGTYLTAWFSAFTPEGRRLAPLTSRRLLFLLMVPAGLMLLVLHWCALALDHVLFPAFRRVPIREPVFVLGVPRSGTTYLHRRLAASREFSTTRAWEVLLAPAICERRVLQGLGALDDLFGGFAMKSLRKLVARLSGSLQEIHEVGIDAEEEDYLGLLAAAGCFFAFLAFPQSQHFKLLGRLDALPSPSRKRLLDHYHGLLQRHLYVSGGGRLLSKNAAFASWMPYLHERYPDAVFLVCIRNPESALSSQLSSLAGARGSFASFPVAADLTQEFATFYEHWYQVLDQAVVEAGERCLIIDQSALRNNEGVILNELYERLGVDVAAKAPSTATENAAGGPGHKHDLASWPLTPSAIAAMEAMTASYDSLLGRTRPSDKLKEVAL